MAAPCDREETVNEVDSGMLRRSPVTHVSSVDDALKVTQRIPSTSTTASFGDSGRFSPETVITVPPDAEPNCGETDVTTGVTASEYEYEPAWRMVTLPDQEDAVIAISQNAGPVKGCVTPMNSTSGMMQLLSDFLMRTRRYRFLLGDAMLSSVQPVAKGAAELPVATCSQLSVSFETSTVRSANWVFGSQDVLRIASVAGIRIRIKLSWAVNGNQSTWNSHVTPLLLLKVTRNSLS